MEIKVEMSDWDKTPESVKQWVEELSQKLATEAQVASSPHAQWTIIVFP